MWDPCPPPCWTTGGMLDTQKAEYLLDDMWTIDLNKMDAWHCLELGQSTNASKPTIYSTILRQTFI